MNSAAHFEAIVSEQCEALYRFAPSLTPFRRSGTRTRWQPLSVLAAILSMAPILTGCSSKPEPSKGNATTLPTVKVRVQTIENKSHTTSEEVVGTVRAKTQATLEAKVKACRWLMPWWMPAPCASVRCC
jgi:hypothetical protein